MSDDNNNAVSYLQALRQSAVPTAPPDHQPVQGSSWEAGNPANGPKGEAAHQGIEHRRSPRYKCEGSAELRQEGLDLRTWATFTDISVHGCYVEVTAAYPVGTLLNIKLEVNGILVRAKGSVRVSYHSLGMGIAFTEISDEDRARLRELLKTISRPSVIVTPGAGPTLAATRPLGSLPAITDAMAAIRTIIGFFEVGQILTQQEFLRLLHKSQESKAE